MAYSFQRTSPFPISQAGVGGGTPTAPVAIDPRGLVPINRAQPLATDNAEPQRLMERRLGSMPPSSFAGSGAGFVPADRASAPAVASLSNQMTDAARMEQGINQGTASAPPMSAEALNKAYGQARYLGPQNMADIAVARQTDRRAVNDPDPVRRGLGFGSLGERGRQRLAMIRERLAARRAAGLLGRS